MPFNERITNHRLLMRRALSKLREIEQAENLFSFDQEFLTDRKVNLIAKYGEIMTELVEAVTTDVGMPYVEPQNVVELAENELKSSSL